MASETDVINAALEKLGAELINTHPDSTTVQGRLASRTYGKLRDRLLRSHPWSFAMKRAAPSAAGTAPVWEYDNAFNLPSDCLRVMEVENATQSDWQIEGRQIVTDLSSPINILYVARVEDPTLWDALFYDALAAFLAKEWALPLTQQAELEFEKREEAKEVLREARTANGQEGFPKVIESSEWIDARFR